MTLVVGRPVISGLSPDPSVCRVGDDYYLACSSFEYFPGVPLYRSPNLVDWTHVANVLSRPDQLDVHRAEPSHGVYAPTLRHRNGRFWLVTTHSGSTGEQLLVHTDDPCGPWSPAIRIGGISGIDPDLTWDESGGCHLTYSGRDPSTGQAAILQVRLAADMTSAEGAPLVLWHGTGGSYPEAPHLYHVGDWWYLVIAEGGTERGHSVTVARSRNLTGPFESNSANPILSMRGTDSSVQNTGHADLVQRPDGSWAMVFLGVRPAGITPGWHVLGRETFAADVDWLDDWPVVTTAFEPGEPGRESRSWDFGRLGELGCEWFAPSARDLSFATVDDRGLHIVAGKECRLLGQRLRHQRATLSAMVSADRGTGGLAIRIDPRHELSIEVGDGVVQGVARVGDLAHQLGKVVRASEWAELRIDVVDPGCGRQGPDDIVLSVRQLGDSVRTELGRLDGRYLSTEVAGGFTGRVFGLFARAGELSVKSLTYEGQDSP